jgi:ABC-type polysaccharide/polyol phosphate transport system ATPase subunit
MPDEGRIDVNGRVSALIQLGAGFLSNLSGRENIYLNGMYMGMSKNEIDAVYDNIVNFSELAPFIESPIRHYSSGMKARLGFSVAVHTKPEILIIDEVLGAGDRKFRIKAEQKMQAFLERAKAIVLVSHDLRMLHRLCNRCLWLEKGSIKALGPSDEILERYAQQ